MLCASRACLINLTAHNLVDGLNHFEIISLGADVAFRITAGLLVYVLLNQIDYCFNPFPFKLLSHTYNVNQVEQMILALFGRKIEQLCVQITKRQ